MSTKKSTLLGNENFQCFTSIKDIVKESAIRWGDEKDPDDANTPLDGIPADELEEVLQNFSDSDSDESTEEVTVEIDGLQLKINVPEGEKENEQLVFQLTLKKMAKIMLEEKKHNSFKRAERQKEQWVLTAPYQTNYFGHGFAAVSHIWGAKVEEYELDGYKVFASSLAKAKALFAATVDEGCLPVWLDVISVDQENQAMKNAQVSLMFYVYQWSTYTKIILEPRDAKLMTEFAKMLTKAVRDIDGIVDCWNNQSTQTMVHLLERVSSTIQPVLQGQMFKYMDHHRRVWTMQEIFRKCAAPFHQIYFAECTKSVSKMQIYYGYTEEGDLTSIVHSQSICDDLTKLMELIQKVLSLAENINSTDSIASMTYKITESLQDMPTVYLFAPKFAGTLPRLRVLLSSDRDCKFPHDYVFGALAALQALNVTNLPQVDYMRADVNILSLEALRCVCKAGLVPFGARLNNSNIDLNLQQQGMTEDGSASAELLRQFIWPRCEISRFFEMIQVYCAAEIKKNLTVAEDLCKKLCGDKSTAMEDLELLDGNLLPVINLVKLDSCLFSSDCVAIKQFLEEKNFITNSDAVNMITIPSEKNADVANMTKSEKVSVSAVLAALAFYIGNRKPEMQLTQEFKDFKKHHHFAGGVTILDEENLVKKEVANSGFRIAKSLAILAVDSMAYILAVPFDRVPENSYIGVSPNGFFIYTANGNIFQMFCFAPCCLRLTKDKSDSDVIDFTRVFLV
ncbi:hypothetical protein HK100_012510 [Physocladia obscura]|uniref:Heterokaryon incompatibility domain-containing protein n=1 Tax=Physocladia obscura TaxID=109957 RepID=A0AAD5XD57_9FUNG|nr:hypothetical protein HK100_012510 [Physocladia obscura]